MASSEPKTRLASIDTLRGIVMILMALDHVRDFFGPTSFPPTALDDPGVTSALFLTRWMTHFCAPVFVFLAGTSAFLWWKRRPDSTRRALSAFLLTRGLWLIVIEFAIVSPSWGLAVYLNPNVGFRGGYFAFVQVIWAIGVSMVIMSVVVWLPLWGIGAFGAVLVSGHNLLEGALSWLLEYEAFYGLPTDWFGRFAVLLHGSGNYFRVGQLDVLVIYSVLPWPGVMAFGFVFGLLMRAPEKQRAIGCIAIGTGAAALFVVSRWFGLYGEPQPRAEYGSTLRTTLSFINTTKYPPSLQFLLMTLGPAIAALPALEKLGSLPRGAAVLDPVVTFGRVPFFYYLLHLPLINLASVAYAWTQGWPGSWWFAILSGGRTPEEYRPNLWMVYSVWIAVVVLLYPACRWFARVRAGRSWWWLRYL